MGHFQVYNYRSLCPASHRGMAAAQPLFSSASRTRLQGWDTFGTGVDASPPVQYHFASEEDAGADLCRRRGYLLNQGQLVLVAFVLYNNIAVFVAVPCQLKQIPK